MVSQDGIYVSSCIFSWCRGSRSLSQAKETSNILAVLLLQETFGMTKDKGNAVCMVTLFETRNDLEHSAKVLGTLLSLSTYVGAIGCQKGGMVEYFDNAKDAGTLAA